MKNVEKYPHILENWLKHYISSMNDTGNLIPGDNTGEAPLGVKIIFLDHFSLMIKLQFQHGLLKLIKKLD